MIDELELIKQILGDLSGVGIWGFMAFLGYSLSKTILVWGGFFYIINKAIVFVFEYLKADVTKAECQAVAKEAHDIRTNKERGEADHYAEVTRLKADVEKVKHLYKILKESSSKDEVKSND